MLSTSFLDCDENMLFHSLCTESFILFLLENILPDKERKIIDPNIFDWINPIKNI